jgi:hypothetical protein
MNTEILTSYNFHVMNYYYSFVFFPITEKNVKIILCRIYKNRQCAERDLQLVATCLML